MKDLINKIVDQAIWPFEVFLAGVAVLFFVYGLVELLSSADNEQKKIDGKRHMVWGLVGLFIISSVYGIIKIIEASIIYLSG